MGKHLSLMLFFGLATLQSYAEGPDSPADSFAAAKTQMEALADRYAAEFKKQEPNANTLNDISICVQMQADAGYHCSSDNFTWLKVPSTYTLLATAHLLAKFTTDTHSTAGTFFALLVSAGIVHTGADLYNYLDRLQYFPRSLLSRERREERKEAQLLRIFAERLSTQHGIPVFDALEFLYSSDDKRFALRVASLQGLQQELERFRAAIVTAAESLPQKLDVEKTTLLDFAAQVPSTAWHARWGRSRRWYANSLLHLKTLRKQFGENARRLGLGQLVEAVLHPQDSELESLDQELNELRQSHNAFVAEENNEAPTTRLFLSQLTGPPPAVLAPLVEAYGPLHVSIALSELVPASGSQRGSSEIRLGYRLPRPGQSELRFAVRARFNTRVAGAAAIAQEGAWIPKVEEALEQQLLPQGRENLQQTERLIELSHSDDPTCEKRLERELKRQPQR